MTDVQQIIKEGAKFLTDKGVKIDVTDEQIKFIGEGLTALFDVITKVQLKKAEAAGQVGADSVTTVEQANALLKAVADSEVKK